MISTICDPDDADGLYSIDSTQHSPLIGFAFDGFPIYGAYGFMNADGSGGITRIRLGRINCARSRPAVQLPTAPMSRTATD